MATHNQTTTKTTTTRARKTKVAAAVDQVMMNDEAEVVDAKGKKLSIEAIKARIASFKLTESQKTVIGFLANLVTIGATYYVSMSIVLVIATAVAGFTGSVFLTWMTLFIGQVLGIFAALLAGARVQKFIVEDGYKSVLAAPSKLMSWLSRAKASVDATAPAGV